MAKRYDLLPQEQRARLSRVARGLLDPQRRPAYLAALRRAARRIGRDARTAPDRPRCRACASVRVTVSQTAFRYEPEKSFPVHVCANCGYVGNPGNLDDFTRYTAPEQLEMAPRVGTETKAGREYHMVAMGADILALGDLDVLLYGPGRSLDYRRIERLPAVRRVMLGDIVDLLGAPNFFDVRTTHDRRYDLVVASEVIEHFQHPPREFARLFRLVDKRGLLVCSTNVYDGGDLTRQAYLFIPGHTSYYSPLSLTKIAAKAGMYVDFRVPIAATTYAGPRKRYVLFTRSVDRLTDIGRYFGDHTYAPSER